MLVVMLAAIAHADDFDPRFTAYLKLADTRDGVSKAIHDQVANWNAACTDIKLADESSLAIVRPIVFAEGADKPSDGAWIESVAADACGTKHLHNVESIARDGSIETASLLNGTTLATIELQNDAIASVLLAAGAQAVEGCDDKFITDTEFKDFEGEPIVNATDGPEARRWREIWTVSACKKEVSVPVVFTPDETGTGIAVESSDAKAKD